MIDATLPKEEIEKAIQDALVKSVETQVDKAVRDAIISEYNSRFYYNVQTLVAKEVNAAIKRQIELILNPTFFENLKAELSIKDIFSDVLAEKMGRALAEKIVEDW